MTPREKWDQGIKLTGPELTELLREGPIAERLLEAMGDEPLPVEQLAGAIDQTPDKTLELLQHLASDPVWLAREVPGAGWVLQYGDQPPASGSRPAPEAPRARRPVVDALVRLGPLGEAALGDDSPLRGLGSAYSTLAVASRGPLAGAPAATQPLMHLQTDEPMGRLNTAILIWGRKLAGRSWDVIAPDLHALFGEFLVARFPWLSTTTATELALAYLSIAQKRIDINVQALQHRLDELTPRGGDA